MFVEISNDQAEELQEYADLSGVPIKQSVAEALEEFIECCVSSRTECLVAQHEQIAKLQVLRGEKVVKPKSFRKRISTTDAIRAKALGIKLD